MDTWGISARPVCSVFSPSLSVRGRVAAKPVAEQPGRGLLSGDHLGSTSLAHSTHVKGAGSYQAGVESPRIQVTLSTRIPPEDCARLNLGYLDPASIDLSEWRNREGEGILYVPKAGETLYKLKE